MDKKAFSIRSRAESFSFAFSGFWVLVKGQPNFRIHLVAGVTAISLGFWLEVGIVPLAVLALAVGAVLCAEAMNTAVEMMVNMTTSQRSWPAKWAKDVAAAGVLLMAAGAFMAGLLILGPPLYQKILQVL